MVSSIHGLENSACSAEAPSVWRAGRIVRDSGREARASASTDKRHDFDVLLFEDHAGRALRARHELSVDFDSHNLRAQAQGLDQLNHSRVFGDLGGFAIELDLDHASILMNAAFR